MIAALPITVWLKDSFFSFCTVKGTSMEPTLLDGDIVLVRKSDGLWQRWTRNTPTNGTSTTTTTTTTPTTVQKESNDDNINHIDTDGDKDHNKNKNSPSQSQSQTEEKQSMNERWMMERREVLVHEKMYCSTTGTTGLLLHKPPIPIVGDIVIYNDPQTYTCNYNHQWNIKRVIGLGGQTVRCVACIDWLRSTLFIY
jgi:hypothetical protein